MADGRDKIDLLHKTILALACFIESGSMPGRPDRDMLDIAGEVAAAAAAGQLDSRRIRAANGGDVQVAVAIHLHAGEEHAPHITACGDIEEVGNANRQDAAL